MASISVREVVLVLAIAVVSTNWAIDHYSQLAWQNQQQRELVAVLESHDKMLKTLGFEVSRDGSGVHLATP